MIRCWVRAGAVRAAGLWMMLALGGCIRPELPMPEPMQIPAPNPNEVDRVLFLLGDAGIARMETHPLLTRLQQDIEQWAGQLGRDSAVSLLVLGDNVYPLGLHPPGTPQYPADSSVVMGQVRLVAGPMARERDVIQYFLAGNHDVGLKQDREGYVRLRLFEDFLFKARAETGASTYLVPVAGTGGPYVLDWGPSIRLIFLDTPWWLLQADEAERMRVLASLDDAMRTAGSRRVIFAAHHPLRTAGPHGGAVSFWSTLGLQYLLVRSGAILQDLTSVPYRRLERGLRSIFQRYDPPLLFVGGHEHSLQVIEAVEPSDPRYTLVSGSGSKVSEVGTVDGLRYARSALGYMRLVIEKDGDVSVFMEAAPAGPLECPAQAEDHAACMARGVASFSTVHSQWLR
ncbi:MAG: metallophosphoesterase [Gemmatimonadetes bacterium]|nr:metallophosphoesterase [Gemmatimonadota bacterium]